MSVLIHCQTARKYFEVYVHICDSDSKLAAPGRQTTKSGAVQLRRTKDGDAEIGRGNIFTKGGAHSIRCRNIHSKQTNLAEMDSSQLYGRQ